MMKKEWYALSSFFLSFFLSKVDCGRFEQAPGTSVLYRALPLFLGDAVE
jgi:hypothetical protein